MATGGDGATCHFGRCGCTCQGVPSFHRDRGGTGVLSRPGAHVPVVGGGPAGLGAAIAVARLGAKTLVVEQFNCLGSVAAAS